MTSAIQAAVPAVRSWTPNPGPFFLGLTTVTILALLAFPDELELVLITAIIFCVSLVCINDDSFLKQTAMVHSNL